MVRKNTRSGVSEPLIVGDKGFALRAETRADNNACACIIIFCFQKETNPDNSLSPALITKTMLFMDLTRSSAMPSIGRYSTPRERGSRCPPIDERRVRVSQ